MQESDNYTQLPFFNKKQSTFVPPNGRDTYLDFYIEDATQEILRASPNRKLYSNISKEEMEWLRSLSQDDSVVIRKADKSNMIVIMNKTDYIKEKKKGKRKVQGVPQSQTVALPRPQEEEETDKCNQAQIEQTYEKH